MRKASRVQRLFAVLRFPFALLYVVVLLLVFGDPQDDDLAYPEEEE